MGRTTVVLPLLLACATSLVADSALAQTGSRLFEAHDKARASGRFGMLLKQFRAEEAALPERHEAGRKERLATYQDARDIPAGYWVWQRPYWFVFRDGPGDAPLQRGWGPEAACGAPDTPQPGDHRSAWATKEQDRADEWILLEYDTPVPVSAIEIHETHKPGAVQSIAIFTHRGEELELWKNKDVGPTKQAGRVLQVDLAHGFEVQRVKLYLASEAVAGWNEIDAVGLHDLKKNVHWAARATASSTYADLDKQQGAVFIAQPNRVVIPQLQPVPMVQPRIIGPKVRAQVQLPRVVLKAPKIQVAPNRIVFPKPLFVDEKAALQKRVAELEAKVKELEAELLRARAGK